MTIFGESAGAMSAHALTLSPKAYGLFSGENYTNENDTKGWYNKPSNHNNKLAFSTFKKANEDQSISTSVTDSS